VQRFRRNVVVVIMSLALLSLTAVVGCMPGRGGSTVAATRPTPAAVASSPAPIVTLRDARVLPASYTGGDCFRQVFYASVTIAVSRGPVVISFRWYVSVNGQEQTGVPVQAQNFAGSGSQSFVAVWRQTGVSFDAAMAFRLDVLAPVTQSSPTLTGSLTCTT
jgi:hypothetical protein